jgi:hypothetical protein
MKKISVRQVVTILVTLLTIGVNAMANTLPLNGQGTGEISDRFDVFFIPAGYVFSIWGLIYIGLLAYMIYQALPAQRENALLKRIAPLYWLSSLANVVWLFLWHYEVFSLTLVAMLTILASLLAIYMVLSPLRAGSDRKLKTFVQLPFSIYLGWISVATIANVTQVLFTIGWSGWGISAEIWTVVMLLVAAALGIVMRFRENELAYPLVLIWAVIGIGLKHATVGAVVTAAWVSVALLILALILKPLLSSWMKSDGVV